MNLGWFAPVTLTLTLVAGCSSDPDPAPQRTAPAVPAEIVGTWSTITPSGIGFSYQIEPTGTYVYVGIMRTGTLQTALQETGRVDVAGETIRFTPGATTITRTDLNSSSEDYQRTTVPPPRILTWVAIGNELSLTADGSTGVFQRE